MLRSADEFKKWLNFFISNFRVKTLKKMGFVVPANVVCEFFFKHLVLANVYQFKFLKIFLISLLFANWASALCVSSYKANLREGPGSRHPISWVAGRYTPLVEVDRKGGWIKVKDQDGQKHWIGGGLVTKSIRCMAIKVRKSNIRTGPGSNFKPASWKQADLYTPLKRLEKEEDWYKVQDAFGNKFWVHRSNVWLPLKSISISF